MIARISPTATAREVVHQTDLKCGFRTQQKERTSLLDPTHYIFTDHLIGVGHDPQHPLLIRTGIECEIYHLPRHVPRPNLLNGAGVPSRVGPASSTTELARPGFSPLRSIE